MSTVDFDTAVEQTHLALREFVKGNPVPMQQRFSHQEDVTLANPVLPAVRGWKQVAATMERAAAQLTDGEITAFERGAQYVTPGLAYTAELDGNRGRIMGMGGVVARHLR